MSKEIESQNSFKHTSTLFLVIVSAISLLAMAGWVFHLPILASVRPDFIPMAPITALIFLGLCGVWFIYRDNSDSDRARILVQVALLGLLILVLLLTFRYFFGLGPDLENWLFPSAPLLGEIRIARISPLTALGFILAILAFLLMSRRELGQSTKTASGALSLAVLILSGINILGYLYGAPQFYGGTLIPVAVTTALSFMFLSLGLLLTAGPTCWPVSLYVGTSLKARLLRAFIPVSLGIVLLQGLLSTASAQWITNLGLRVAIVALVTSLIVMQIINLISQNLSAEIERGNQARLKAENFLKQSEARFRSLAETANDAIINVDRDGQIVFWNHAAEMIFGYSTTEVMEKSLGIIMPEEFYPAHEQRLQRVVLTGKSKNIGKTVEVTGLRKDGSKFPLALSLATWQVGEDIFFTGIARDISERKRSEDELQSVLQSTADGILAIGSANEVLYFNDRFVELWRIPEMVMASKNDSLLLQHVLDQLIDPQSFLKKVQDLYRSKEDSFDVLNFKDGRVFERLSRPLIKGEEAQGRVWSFRDITQRKRFELVQNAIYKITQAAITSNGIDALYQSIHTILGELISAENFFIALYDSATGLIRFPYFIDQYDKPSSVPTPMHGLTGYVIKSGRSLSITREIYDRLVQQNEVEAVGTVAEAYLRVPLKIEDRIIGVIGVQSYIKGVHFHQEDVNLLEFVSNQVAQAIGRKRLEEEILSLSLTDELTGLNNRRGFTLLAEQELKMASRLKRDMLLFFGDVDNLKTINDTWGHAQGDQALKDISAIMKNNFRESDILARIGGDEFVVLAVDASMECAEDISNRIQSALDLIKLPGDETYHLALSLGVSFFNPHDPCTLNELINKADNFMYEQKHSRKGK